MSKLRKRGRSPATGKDVSRPAGTRASASLAVLWGGRERPARGRRPVLTLDRVVDAALDVADEEGLSALTMTRVAERLGVTPMAIYRYIPGKEEMLDVANDAALGPPPAPGRGGWRAELTAWARAALQRFERRPWLLESAQSRVPIGPNWLGWLDAGLRALERSGLPPHERVTAIMLIDGHVRATAQLSISAAATARWGEDFRRVLDEVRDDARFRAVAQVAASGGFVDTSGQTPFEFGLERILDGLEARLPKARARRR